MRTRPDDLESSCTRTVQGRDRTEDRDAGEKSGQSGTQSVVFVLEFLRFTDVRSGKAFEI